MTCILPGGLGALKAAVLPPSTWDPANSSSYAYIYNNNISLASSSSFTTNFANSRGTRGFNSGKRYFELQFNPPENTSYSAAGICNSSFAITGSTSGVGQDGAASNSAVVTPGSNYYAISFGGQSFSTFSRTPTNGDQIGVAIDLTAGQIWFSVMNVWWSGQTPPAGPNITFTPGAIWFPAGSMTNVNGSVQYVVGANLRFAPPAGFTPWT
jgi:hypothetical protein